MGTIYHIVFSSIKINRIYNIPEYHYLKLISWINGDRSKIILSWLLLKLIISVLITIKIFVFLFSLSLRLLILIFFIVFLMTIKSYLISSHIFGCVKSLIRPLNKFLDIFSIIRIVSPSKTYSELSRGLNFFFIKS